MIARAISLLIATPARSKTSRRMQASCAAYGKSIPAAVVHVDQRLIRP